MKATVLKVAFMQYVTQNSAPDEPPSAGPSAREIMKYWRNKRDAK